MYPHEYVVSSAITRGFNFLGEYLCVLFLLMRLDAERELHYCFHEQWNNFFHIVDSLQAIKFKR
jgi:hypothetical protein